MYKRDNAPDIYIVTGYTDFRCGINRLSEKIRDTCQVDVFSNSVFIFSCKRKDRLKILYWGGAGFWLLSYRLEEGKFNWLKENGGLLNITRQQFEWLLNGLEIAPKKLIKEYSKNKQI